MSKQNLTLSLDQEIVTKLKEETNYSDVVNEQLKAFYTIKKCENEVLLNQKLAETKQILKEKRKERREIEAVLLKINKKQKLFKKKMLSRSKMIKEIERKRSIQKQNRFRSVSFHETAEAEADRLMKGGNN